MWNKSLMWNNLFDVEQPKEVELVQRGGTGPKINQAFSVEMEQPKEVEQAQEQRIDQQYLGASQYFPRAGWRSFLLGPGK